MKLWDKISSLIASDAGEEEQRPAKPEPKPKDIKLGGSSLSPAAANSVLSMLPKGQSLDQFAAGQVQLLNIETVRADLGDRWAKLEHQVHGVVEATLRRMLTDSDIFTQIGDFEYLVIFPNLTEQKASALMYVAAAQIRKKLFGYDSAFADIRLNATVTRVGRDLIDSVADPIAAVQEAMLLARPAEPEAEAPQEGPPTPGIASWGKQYKVVPIEGGGMTKGRIVADAPRAGSPTPDFSTLTDRAPGAAPEPSSGNVPWDSGEPAPVAGYQVVPITGSGRPEHQLVKDTSRPQKRMPDFSTAAETSRTRSPSATDGSQPARQASQAEAESVHEIQGYAVVPITGGGMTEGHLVQGAPRTRARLPDFSSAQAPTPPGPQPAPADTGNPGSPVFTARLDALASRSTPGKFIPISRPADARGRPESSAGAAAGDPGASVEIDELQLDYEPIWDVRRQAVTAYRMKITLSVAGAVLGLAEFCMTYDDPKLQESLNSMILRKLVSQIQSKRGEDKRAIIVAPIGRRFIDDENGLRFLLDQVSNLNDQERPLVVLEIGDVYLGSLPTLALRIAMIRRVCRNVSLRLSLDHKDFGHVAATGATMVAGDLSDHDWPERQTMAALNEFAAAASKASLRSFIGGLATSSTVIAALGAGLNHLSGAAIGEGAPAPLGVYPLSTEGFYLQRQAQRSQQEQGS